MSRIAPSASNALLGAFLAAAATTLCLAAVAPASEPAGAPPGEVGVDESLRPGEDFFAWANGAWLKSSEIPPGKDRVSARTEIEATTRRQIVDLLADSHAAPAGTAARQVADFHAAYMNATAIETQGIAALKPHLARIDAVVDKAGLVRLLGAGMRADVDPLNWGIYDSSHLLGLSVEMGNRGEPEYVAFLLQGGLGLGDRKPYHGSEAPLQELRSRYQQYIARLLTLAGVDTESGSSGRSAAVLALETAIARSHATQKESANDRNADNLWTRADFARRAPGLDWAELFAAGGLTGQPAFVVWQPSAVRGAAALVASQPLAAWKDYLRFHELHRRADLLPKPFAEAAAALREATAAAAGAAPKPSSRAERAQSATLSSLREEVGRIYIERHFSAADKKRVEAIVAQVVAAFRRRLEAVSWLTPTSRSLALAKLDRLYFGVGYPEPLPESPALRIDRADAVGNFDRLVERSYARALSRLGKPVDRTEWWMTPQTVGALLLFQQNAYNFPAALLQPPKFDPAASDAANYGAIGAIVGHEVSHLVDTLGAEYDASGAQRHWWTADDHAGYLAATAPLVEQFANYRPFPDLAVDGQRTLSENLADLGGLAAAFDAHRAQLGSRAGDPAIVRRLDREFFIGFARAWRSKIRDEAIRAQVKSADTHAPETYRVSTVRNLDAWYEAFDVQPGDRLYLSPEKRVRIW